MGERFFGKRPKSTLFNLHGDLLECMECSFEIVKSNIIFIRFCEFCFKVELYC